MRALLLTSLLAASLAWADEKDGDEAEAKVDAKPAEAKPTPSGCTEWDAPGMPEGPVAVGFLEADLGMARRVCPRTEVGLAAAFGAIIDTPGFYGDLSAGGVLHGSWAMNEKTELFATLEAVDFTYVQNAALKQSSLALGHATVGASRVSHSDEHLAAAFSARVLLPTSFQLPNARVIGAEVGHALTSRPTSWLELHSYVGFDATTTLSNADAVPRFGVSGTVGAQWAPASWFSLVLDVSGRAGPRSYLAPAGALRFRVSSLGIELGATAPVAGTDRHDLLGTLRFSWRL